MKEKKIIINEGLKKVRFNPHNKQCLPQEPKFWNELNSDEKIERMREQIKELNRQIMDIRRNVQALCIHRHNAKNEVVVEETIGNMHYLEYAKNPTQNPDEVYF